MKKLLPFLSILFLFSCTDTTQQGVVSNLEKELAEAKTKLSAMTAKETPATGMIHNVFFWLKEDLSEEQKAAYLEGVNSLTSIESVVQAYIGPPAPTEERGVVDNSFSYALLLHFENVAGQNAYQVDPIHLKFVEDHKDKWTKVVVYDNLLLE